MSKQLSFTMRELERRYFFTAVILHTNLVAALLRLPISSLQILWLAQSNHLTPMGRGWSVAGCLRPVSLQVIIVIKHIV